jgi:hypothetical protein
MNINIMGTKSVRAVEDGEKMGSKVPCVNDIG